MMEYNDSLLIDQYLHGDKKSLELIIQKYLKPIYGFIFQFVGNSHDAEDLTQEVFVKMWRWRKKIKKEKSFKSWLFTIAKNTAIDFLRKRKELTFSDLDSDNDDDRPFIETISDDLMLPDEIFQQANLEKIISAALEKLPLQYHLVITLHYQNEFTFSEISNILNKPLNTVKSHWQRGLLMLKKVLLENPLN